LDFRIHWLGAEATRLQISLQLHAQGLRLADVELRDLTVFGAASFSRYAWVIDLLSGCRGLWGWSWRSLLGLDQGVNGRSWSPWRWHVDAIRRPAGSALGGRSAHVAVVKLFNRS
jgi:hypothetical protein